MPFLGGGGLPDEIMIFRDTLVRDFGDDPERLRQQVITTVRHESVTTSGSTRQASADSGCDDAARSRRAPFFSEQPPAAAARTQLVCAKGERLPDSLAVWPTRGALLQYRHEW